MGYILGIDTGGTYTDAVIIDDNKRVIAKAKSFTTHENLAKGIDKCLIKMSEPMLCKIKHVHLSTTLAVNSILERKFERVGLLQIGKEIDVDPPANYVLTIGNAIHAECKFAASEKISQIKQISKMFSGNVDYVTVTSANTGKAYSEEHMTADIIKTELGLDVFCASDYSHIEDYTDRTIKSMFTVYLVPMIDSLINNVKGVMEGRGIHAELKIVNAMGTLITCDEVRKNPLSTLFSGLAASVKGGLALTENRDFLLVDMGGTSTDITRIIDRRFREVRTKSKIREFLINENTMDVQTFGIGGDSHIKINLMGKITAGPQKAIPICVMSSIYPYLVNELQMCRKPDNYEMITAQEVDCFIGVKGHMGRNLTSDEKQIAEYLVDNPHNIFIIADKFKRDPDALHLDKLMRAGAVKLISITPTDILHSEGEYTAWDVKGANAAIRHMAKQLGVTKTLCIQQVKRVITEILTKACMQSIANFEKQCFSFDESSAASFLLERFHGNESSILSVDFGINKPVVALGAPSAAWLKEVTEKLNTELIIPENGEVANAFGAAVADNMKG